MAQETLHGHVVEGAEFEALGQFAHGDDDLVRLFVLDEATVHRHNLVGGGLVDTGDDLAVLLAKGGLHLVAVVVGAVHADDLVHVAVFAQEFDHLDLLKAELTLVGHILQLTSATLLGVGTFRYLFTHNSIFLYQRRHIFICKFIEVVK